MSNCKLQSHNGFLILSCGIKKFGDIELPDNVEDIGASSGEVVVPCEEAPYFVGQKVYFDGAKAFKIAAEDENYIAVHFDNIICVELN